MGPLHSPVATPALPSLRWADICARRREEGDGWPASCPICRQPFGERDADVRWLADFGRLVHLPDGCAAHRYCAVENPHRDPALITGHAHDEPRGESDRRAGERRAA